jgi:hypothetical protein
MGRYSEEYGKPLGPREARIGPLFLRPCNGGRCHYSTILFFGTDYADDTDLVLFVLVAGNQAPDSLLRTILRKGRGPVC